MKTLLGVLQHLLLVVVFVPQILLAQSETLGQMQHNSWAGHDGAPLGIHAVTMSPDGLLYLGTMSGVYRFDGASFEAVPTPGVKSTSTVRNLFFDQQGDLLIMLAHGAPILLHKGNGQTELLDRIDSGLLETISNVQQTPDGRLWAVINERGLVQLGQDHVWHTVPDPQNGHGHMTHLFADPRGTLWLVVEDHLYRLPPHQKSFLPTSIYVYGEGKIMSGNHSDLWIATSGPATSPVPAKHLQHISDTGEPLPAPDMSLPLSAAYQAPDGSLWLLTTQSALIHLPGEILGSSTPVDVGHWKDQLVLRSATREDGAYAFFPAHDGSIWVGGLGGVEHFKQATLVPLLQNVPAGLWEQCSEKDGSQWILASDRTVYRRDQDGSMKVKEHLGDALHCSEFGTLVSSDAGLISVSNGGEKLLPTLPGLKGYGNHYIFTGATWTSRGTIVAAAAGGALGRSLWEYRAQAWHRLDSGNPSSELSGMAAWPSGEVYLGFRDGTVGILDPGAERVRLVANCNYRPVLGFSRTSKGLIVYGVGGISLAEQEKCRTLQFEDQSLSKVITGVAETPDGDIWLNGARGIVRVSSREFAAATLDARHRLLANNISEGDFTGPAAPRLFAHSVQFGVQGRVWFNTLNGVVSIAPGTVHSPEPPPLVIKDVRADNAPLPANNTLAPGVNTLSIGYIGIDFSDPSGLTYAYKLDGYDNAWQDVGSRTEAVYTHLRAGKYVFSVKARNAYGIWTDPVSLPPFWVLPHFYERGWFLAILALLALLAVWVALQFRLRKAAAEIRQRAEERADERVRIARDLHDTLLQGVQGLLLSFHAAIEGVPSEHASRPPLERALTTAEKLILEGRDRVKGLRKTEMSGDELGQLFVVVAEDLACVERFRLVVSPNSTARTRLRDSIAAELFLIGREAIVNAARHSEATQIIMRLHFAEDCFTLECEDNGVGFDLEDPDFIKRQSHWGISGMRERVETLQGVLRIHSAPGDGTCLSVQVKAKQAYL
ncbi:triple tyrosine motif-containing protein [Silvibacterium acidisoli]|uniref:triple tyrosine motif-containing protein n=1 Tax=Acidobacteriaceae bacterium ZG23-2 TaxID=2883246 RepID=UPI00406C7B22